MMSFVKHTPADLPREKINVLILGNHSSGKSSFINWYIGETVQKESAAMETGGFSIITSGEKRDTFEGAATLRFVPMLEGAEKFPGLMDNLTTEVCTSRARHFDYINFIDSPGLTDANLQYPFDINEALLWISSKVDLIFVFFDPHGQATCARTNQVIRMLEATDYRTRIHYFLTKADLLPNEKERMKVITQLTQTLSRASHSASDKNYGGKYSLDIRPIFRPSGEDLDFDDSYNQLDEMLDLLADCISKNVQRHIHLYEHHCKTLSTDIDRRIVEHHQQDALNTKLTAASWIMWAFAFMLPLILALNTGYYLNKLFTVCFLFSTLFVCLSLLSSILYFLALSPFFFLILLTLPLTSNNTHDDNRLLSRPFLKCFPTGV